ncbi:MAG: phytoene/squalene synthase family protein [Elusimicrobiota bacterium]
MPDSQEASVPAATERGSNFFLGFLFLPKAKREALSAVYAYCRSIDDIVDDGFLTKSAAAAKLEFWRDEIGRLFSGNPREPIAVRLMPHVRALGLPQEPFLEMIRGCAMDLERSSYETFGDLEPYLQGVACSVGDLAVRIFGYQHTPAERIREYARLYGYAFQMTNILRDVGADLDLGRVYLPEKDMRESGYSREALIRRERGPAFARLMDMEYERCLGFYRKAKSLVDFRDRPALLPAEIMARIYEGVLGEMRRSGYPVFFKRCGLSWPRKISCALDAWLYCHGIHF